MYNENLNLCLSDVLLRQVTIFLTDLNCAHYAAGHDGEFPCD